jgi:hypothetical protein
LARYVIDPRRSPRVSWRFRVTLAQGGDGWQAETEDLGPRGCLIVTPRPLIAGGSVRLVIESNQIKERLDVQGRVVWATGSEPLRAGVAFSEEGQSADPEAWFQQLLRTQPAMAASMGSVPDRLPLDAALFLLPPPQFIVDFGPSELALLQHLDNGMTVEEVLTRAGATVDATRMLFALMARRAITLSLGEACPAWKWKPILRSGGLPPPAPPPAAKPPPRPAPANPRVPPAVAKALGPTPARVAPAAAKAAGRTPARVPSAAKPPPRPAAAPPPVKARPEVRPPTSRSAAAPPGPAPAPTLTRRSRYAQECFDRAQAAVAAGEINGAIALLRRALVLAPGDAEIAAMLGKLAFKDRQL